MMEHYRLARPALRALRQYIAHIKSVEHDVRPALREQIRITMALEEFATSVADGVEATIRGWPRPLLRHYIHPFKVFYERRPDALYVIRLRHYARRPIEQQ